MTTTIKKSAKKRNYGKIDNEILVKAIVSGKTYKEAGILAGSKAKQIHSNVSDKLRHNKKLKKDLISRLEEKRDKILDSIGEDEIMKAPFNQKTIGLAILIDKIQLLKGDPTQRIETIPKMVIEK